MNGFFQGARVRQTHQLWRLKIFAALAALGGVWHAGFLICKTKKKMKTNPREKRERERYRERVIFSHANGTERVKNKTQPTRLELARAEPN